MVLRGLSTTIAAAALAKMTSSPVVVPSSSISTRSSMVPACREIQLHCSDGMMMAGQAWRANEQLFDKASSSSSSVQRILCLHGWMDNARSFHYLAPALVTDQPHVELVALDFLGHGLSSHKSRDGPSMVLSEAVYYVAEALQQLGWISSTTMTATKPDDNPNKSTANPLAPVVTLIGHSMGAGIATFYAAAFPEQVHKLVLLEGAGPLDRNPRDISHHIRAHVTKRLTGNAHASPSYRPRPPRVYPTLESAVAQRCQTAKAFPGTQWLSTPAATELVLRGTIPVPLHSQTDSDKAKQPSHDTANRKPELDDDDDDNDPSTGMTTGFSFCHDPRLQWPSGQFLSWEQTQALYADISCPTALVLADHGWPFDADKMETCLKLLQPQVYTTLPGSHHFHADPESAPRVAETVHSFLYGAS